MNQNTSNSAMMLASRSLGQQSSQNVVVPFLQHGPGLTNRGGRRSTRRRNRNGRRGLRVLNRNRGNLMFPSIVPDRMFVTLRLLTNQAFASFSNASCTIRGNDLFNPLAAASLATQPAGFDQWKTLYSRYRVYSSGCNAKVVPSANNTQPITFALLPTTTASAPFSEVALQQPYTRWGVILSQSPTNCSLYNSMSTSKMFGEPSDVVQYTEGFSATVTTSPNSLWYWQTTAQASDDSTAISGRFIVEVYYECEFYQRILETDA